MITNKRNCYVISLKTATARREHITKEFTQEGIPFEFFDAITPGESLDASISALVPNLAQQHKLSLGEKACFMSHVVLWKKCVDEGLPFIHIFEDDVILGKNVQMMLNDNTWLQERFPSSNLWILKTETFLMKVNTTPSTVPAFQNHLFPFLRSVHYGTAGYTISFATAQYLLKMVYQLSSVKLVPIDHILFDIYLTPSHKVKVYQMLPAFCIQADRLAHPAQELSSQLESERDNLRTHIRLSQRQPSLTHRIIRKIRSLSKILNRFNQKIIPFQ